LGDCGAAAGADSQCRRLCRPAVGLRSVKVNAVVRGGVRLGVFGVRLGSGLRWSGG